MSKNFASLNFVLTIKNKKKGFYLEKGNKQINKNLLTQQDLFSLEKFNSIFLRT